MDIRKIKKIIDLVNENNIAELEIHEEKESIRVTLNKNETNFATIMQASTPIIQQSEQKPLIEQSTKPESIDTKHTVKSPMVGSVYLSATPGSAHFVDIGQQVKAGDTVCLIEAMKMFNRIEADKSGTVTARLVENAQPVEYGQPLFVIE
ncbi:MAG: acetyl-CoA carboxylase, biotin carboxyl carrier protein [uncultured bacterium]|nr:MAG: acetyl-CoA carboxylase, biotin carboxyl carrier protein [uncultured bacterium]